MTNKELAQKLLDLLGEDRSDHFQDQTHKMSRVRQRLKWLINILL